MKTIYCLSFLCVTLSASFTSASNNPDPASPLAERQALSANNTSFHQLSALDQSILHFVQREGLLLEKTEHPFSEGKIDYPGYCLNNEKAKRAYRKQLRQEKTRIKILEHNQDTKDLSRFTHPASPSRTPATPILP